MKKYVIIGLMVVVGVAFVIKAFIPGSEPAESIIKDKPAVFAFQENLATVGNEKVELNITVKEPLPTLELYYNDSLISSWTNVKEDLSLEFEAGTFGVGTREVKLLSTNEEGRQFSDSRFVRVLSDIVPERLITDIVAIFPHNPESFTQGLEFKDGILYEGTGDPGDQGKTLVAQVDIPTGDHIKKVGLPAGYFGEGITILDSVLYQLTWHNQRCYTYNVNDNLNVIGEFSYTGEGWGLCNNGTSLIMSNGTERLVFRNPQDFTIERTIEVYNDRGPITNLNELEYIDGKVYANVWTTNLVVVIDPQTGKVIQEIDGTKLVLQGRGNGEVMNGIALDKESGKIFMTGKNWIKLFEVKFVSPPETVANANPS